MTQNTNYFWYSHSGKTFHQYSSTNLTVSLHISNLFHIIHLWQRNFTILLWHILLFWDSTQQIIVLTSVSTWAWLAELFFVWASLHRVTVPRVIVHIDQLSVNVQVRHTSDKGTAVHLMFRRQIRKTSKLEWTSQIKKSVTGFGYVRTPKKETKDQI